MKSRLRILHLEDDWRDAELARALLEANGIVADLELVDREPDISKVDQRLPTRRAREALRESEARYRLLFESNPQPMWVYDLETLGFLAVNESAIQHYGYSREEFLAMTTKDIGPPEDVPALRHKTGGREQGLDQAGQSRHRKKDGSTIDVEITSHAIEFSGRRGEIVLANDITERKRAEVALIRLAAIVESSEDAIIGRDLSGIITSWNAGATKLFGYSESETLGFPITLLIPPERVQEEAQIMDRVTRGESVRHFETVRQAKDGRLIEVSVRVSPIKNSANKIIGASKVARDMTERKQTEKELQATNQRLEQALAELVRKGEEEAAMTQQLWQASKLATMGELAASIAHELNNPLTTVALRIESLLLQCPEKDPQRAPLEIITQEVDRMATLVNNLLLFSRRSHRQVSTVDVGDEIATSIELVNYHLRNRRIAVVREFASDVPTVQADRQQLRQLFLNLLTNASEAMPRGGTLTLRVRPMMTGSDANAVVVEFADTGEGIARDDLNKIWDPFFTTKPEGRGTGLGLAICRRIVEEHGGTIEIESEILEGTIVRITFPATSNGAAANLL